MKVLSLSILRTAKNAVVIVGVIIASSVPVLAVADKAEELRTQIESRTQEIKQIEAEIASYQSQLTEVGGQKATLQSAIKTLDTTRTKLTKDIQLTDKKIDRTRLAALELGLSIKEKELRIERNREVVSTIIRRIDQSDRETLFEVLLANPSIADFFGGVDELSRLEGSFADSIKSLENLRKDLTKEQANYRAEQERLEALAEEIEDQRRLADQKRVEQNKLLGETKNKESNYKKLLADRQARKKQFEREIDDYEAQLKAIIDPNSIPKPGTKVLLWPVDTPFVTQHFGKTTDARRLYASGTHNGIDFRASPGTPIRAAADGTVMGTGDTDITCRGASYGKWVLVGHPNGLATLYAHLDLIKVSTGESVSAGQLVGYSGTTGYATGPHLHFTVYAKSAVKITDLPSKSCAGAVYRIPVAAQNAYLDPEPYL